MSKVAVSKEKIVAVADAIREKTETSDGLGLDAMPQAIRDIKSGGADFTIDDASYLFYGGARLDQKDNLMPLLKDIKSTAYMFYNCGSSLKEVDLTGLNTSKVTSMSSMFYGCSGLSNIDLSGFDVSKVESMSNMFNGCKFTSIDLSTLETNRLEDIDGMFSGCSNLIDVDMSNFVFWNLDQMTMKNLFYNCSKLKSVKFPSREIRLYNANQAFYNCLELTSIDLSCFDTKKSTGSVFQSTFTGCKKLEEIIGFSDASGTGHSIGFPTGNNATAPVALKRLTFKPYESGYYSIRSAINIKYCSFERSGMVEMFNSLPNISGITLSANYKKITITGNPCLTGTLADGTACETLTDEDRAIATAKGWTLVE